MVPGCLESAMPFVLVRISVEDFRKWKTVMQEHVGKRAELGSRGTRIFRDTEHPDSVLCLTEWTDFDRAREFMGWGDPAKIRGGSTVKGIPDVSFLELVDELSA